MKYIIARFAVEETASASPGQTAPPLASSPAANTNQSNFNSYDCEVVEFSLAKAQQGHHPSENRP